METSRKRRGGRIASKRVEVRVPLLQKGKGKEKMLEGGLKEAEKLVAEGMTSRVWFFPWSHL